MSTNLPPIDASRVLEILSHLQEFTEGPTHTQRLALSAEDARAREYLQDWMLEQNLEVHTDPVGNQFGFRKGRQEGPYVAFGSHLDTVKNAGEFDGTLGIAVSMYFIEWLAKHGIDTKHPLCLINFTNEEGVRFVPSIMGSAYMAEQVGLEHVLDAVALEESVTVREELEKRKLAGAFNSRDLPIRSFLELHIEQGPVLERKGIPIGIVEGVQGMYWTKFLFEGRAQHTGTTPLHLRRNAGQAAAQFVHQAYELSLGFDHHLLTNGVFELLPNAPNIIPSHAKVILDSRNPDQEALQKVQSQLVALAIEVAEEYDVSVTSTAIEKYDPVHFATPIVDAVEEATRDAGLTGHRMFSGAGHDAGLIGMKHPAAMIFIPSKDGISHNPAEYSSPEQIQHGLEVFVRALLKLADS